MQSPSCFAYKWPGSGGIWTFSRRHDPTSYGCQSVQVCISLFTFEMIADYNSFINFWIFEQKLVEGWQRELSIYFRLFNGRGNTTLFLSGDSISFELGTSMTFFYCLVNIGCSVKLKKIYDCAPTMCLHIRPLKLLWTGEPWGNYTALYWSGLSHRKFWTLS